MSDEQDIFAGGTPTITSGDNRDVTARLAGGPNGAPPDFSNTGSDRDGFTFGMDPSDVSGLNSANDALAANLLNGANSALNAHSDSPAHADTEYLIGHSIDSVLNGWSGSSTSEDFGSSDHSIDSGNDMFETGVLPTETPTGDEAPPINDPYHFQGTNDLWADAGGGGSR